MWGFPIIFILKGIMTFQSQRVNVFAKNINFDKNETESKMENPRHTFREMNIVFQLVSESWIKSKAVMSWSSRNEKEFIFLWRLFCPKEIFLNICIYLNYSVLNKLSEYIYFYIS